jgi:hypothetical protein
MRKTRTNKNHHAHKQFPSMHPPQRIADNRPSLIPAGQHQNAPAPPQNSKTSLPANIQAKIQSSAIN